MAKKIVSLMLSALMLVSLTIGVAAEKKPEEIVEVDKNIYAAWGDFEEDGSVEMLTVPNSVATRTKGGANGTDWKVKLDATDPKSKTTFNIKFPAVAGETYDISFWMKTDNIKEINKVSLIFSYTDGGWSYGTSAPVTEGWTQYQSTWYCEGKNTKGEAVSGDCKLEFRFGSPSNGIVYFDELSIVPHGDVSADYSIVNKGFTPVPPIDDTDRTDAPKTSDSVVFSDLSDHWAKETIETLAKFSYVNGMGDGTYAPDATVTRAQFIKMLVDRFSIEAPDYDGRFSDVNAEQWFSKELMVADQLGIIDPVMKLGSKIKPDSAITREEAASIAARAAYKYGAQKKSYIEVSFTDEDSISDWAKENVKDAVSYGLINGYDTGVYLPENTITRAEATQILYRFIEIRSKINIYVDAREGDDKGNGTKTHPLKTVEAAIKMAKDSGEYQYHDIKILMRGKFRINETIKLDETNSGKNGHYIIYTSWGEEKPILTMADEYDDWSLYDEEKNIYRVFVGAGKETRQAYFNDVKGIRARGVSYLKNAEYVDSAYWLGDNTELLSYKHPQDMDLVFYINWCNPRYMVKSVEKTTDGRVKITPHDYFIKNHARIDFAIGRECATPAYLENAYELLDQKYEWYYNKHDGFMYYIPGSGDNMSNMVCKIPTGEYLISASGSDSENPLEYLKFDNITFEGTTWLRPTTAGGHHDAQNNHIREAKGDYAPGAAIHFEKCAYIEMTNNTFRQLGITGIEFMYGSKHIDVIGNYFHDISGTAVTVDDVFLGGTFEERPKDSWCEYVRVNNNYIKDVCSDYKSGAAISFAWPRHSQFNHNEISNATYSGFHIGYGWNNYRFVGSIMYDVEVNYNFIHDVMADRVYDGGGIYTIGASSFECGTEANKEKSNRMWGNHIRNVWNCGYIYPDEGTTGWYYTDNVMDSSLVKEMEYNLETFNNKTPWAMHMHATSIMWLTVENNFATCDYAYRYGWMNQQESIVEPLNIKEIGTEWPKEAQKIIEKAGIEDEYKDNFDTSGPCIAFGVDRFQAMPLETPTDSRLLILDNENESYSLTNYEIDWWCEDPDAFSVDNNGYITAHKKGTYYAYATVRLQNKIFQVFYKFNFGDEIEKVALSSDNISVLSGASIEHQITAYYTFAGATNITADAKANLRIEDESVATLKMVDGGIEITAGLKGSTKVVGTVEYKGKIYNVDVPVNVITISSEEAVTLPFREFSYTSGWKNGATATPDGGYKVSGSPNHHATTYVNELLAFDVSIKPGNSWPAFAFCDNNQMGNYTNSSMYMIAIKSDHIELQRFNQGARTMLFGNNNNPIVGSGIPNVGPDKVFDYNKRYSVVIGALDTEEGTRIVLNVNGKNVLDFTDKASNRLVSRGYFCVYNPTSNGGGTTFYPYSGMTD